MRFLRQKLGSTLAACLINSHHPPCLPAAVSPPAPVPAPAATAAAVAAAAAIALIIDCNTMCCSSIVRHHPSSSCSCRCC